MTFSGDIQDEQKDLADWRDYYFDPIKKLLEKTQSRLTSDASIEINASSDKVWQAITDPATVKEWSFGTTVESDWKAGSPIIFRGEWNGQSYEDKGIIQKIEARRH